MNATMAEVFLVAGFLFLVLAAHHADDKKEAQRVLDDHAGAVSLPETTTSLADRVTFLIESHAEARDARARAVSARREADERAAAADARAVAAEQERQRIQDILDRVQPPYCKGYGKGAEFARIELTADARIDVKVLRPYPGLESIRGGTLAERSFRSRYRPLFDRVRKDKCRLPVLVKDSPDLPKADFKRLNLAVQTYFYSSGHFQ